MYYSFQLSGNTRGEFGSQQSGWISEAAVCELLKRRKEERQMFQQHWKFEEKKSNDRVVIQADIKLGEQSIGNLPVIEMQNHELTQEELNGLIDYLRTVRNYICHRW